MTTIAILLGHLVAHVLHAIQGITQSSQTRPSRSGQSSV